MDNEELRLHHRGWLINPNTSRGQLADSKTILTLLDEQDALQARVAELEAQVLKYDEFWQKGDHPENARLRTALQEIIASAEQTDHRCYYQAVAKRAIRELDGDKPNGIDPVCPHGKCWGFCKECPRE